MSWLKDVIVDLIVTVVIIAAVLISNSWLSGLVWGYTGLLLLIKFSVLASDSMLMNKSKTEAPAWFSHMLYAINTVALLSFGWWYAGVGWALIWIISYLTQQKLEKKAV